MLLTSATLPEGDVCDVRLVGERIAAVEPAGDLDPEPDETVRDLTGKRLFPGMVDLHVHFRQPGFSHKETWETGSRAAAAGGVTTVVDQPNTDPATVDGPGFDEKATLAADSLVDYGLNGGVTADWDPEALFERPLCALGEVFLADSTGDMGVEADLFADAVERATDRGVTVTVHAEDASLFDSAARDRDEADAWSAYRTPEAEVAAVERACEVAADAGEDARLHVAHASTPGGIDAAAEAGLTTEVTPHHLLLSREDLPDLGTFGRMNPPLRSEERRAAVSDRVADGTVDAIATDHAPHTRAEKDASIWDAPSGVPGVETALPLLLAAAGDAGGATRGGPDLSYERVRDLTAANPAQIADLPRKGRIEPGRDADLVCVDPEATTTVRGEDAHSKCDWTPFEGFEAVVPEWTAVRGTVVYERDPETGAERFRDHEGRNVRTADRGA